MQVADRTSTARSGPFRLAIVGAGLITQSTHVPVALSLPDVELVGVVDSVAGRADQLMADYGLPDRGLRKIEDLVGGVDGVIVATPNHTHSAIAVPLLQAGVSTLIEKPLATNVNDGLAIVVAARDAGATVAVSYYQRFLPATSTLKRLLEVEYFGQVNEFCYQFGTVGGWPSLSSYTLNRELIGGGVLVVTGTHFIDRMLHFWGEPDEVEMVDDSNGGPESHCEVRVLYRSGGRELRGLLRFSKSVSLPSGLTIDTEKGLVVVRDGFDDRVTLFPHDRPEIELSLRWPRGSDHLDLDPFQRVLRNFIDACRTDTKPEVDGAQGLASLRLLERMYSNRSLMSVGAEPACSRP